MKTMRRSRNFLLFLLAALLSSGCAVAHRYPAYRGRVLELGTDRPIEGAGVLAVYSKELAVLQDRTSAYVGYQAVLTDNTGRFVVPTKMFTTFTPFSWFDKGPFLTIYKAGYGNFPGITNPNRPKHTTTDPPIGPRLPAEGIDNVVTFRLPKLETEEEISEHDRNFSGLTTNVLDEKGFPPPGTRKGQFLPRKYTGERR
jgi:hypothetical protein